MTKEQGASFRAGNLAKLLRLPLYVLGFLLCLIIPRSKNRWVFASHAGYGEGAKAVAKQLRAQDQGAQITWILDSETQIHEVKAAQFNAVLKSSFKGFWETARAQQIVVTHGLGDANRFAVFGAKIVQLWHGAPIKRIHFDSPITTQVGGGGIVQRLLRVMYARGANQVAFYVAGSEVAAKRMRSAFRVLPGKVLLTGDPRHDELFAALRNTATLTSQREKIFKILEVPDSGQELILYAPTWRDGAADPPGPDPQLAQAIQEFLAVKNALLLIRSHPLGTGDYAALLAQANVHNLSAAKLRDLTPCLGVFDAVITDYSSLAIDFAVTERPIHWFAPDLAEYATKRGLYEPLAVTAQGRVHSNWQELLAALHETATNSGVNTALRQASKRLAARFHHYTDGAAAARVLAAVAEITTPATELVASNSVFFESFYGKQVADNPLAISNELLAQRPELKQYWSVVTESQQVPAGATPVLVGSHLWYAARQQADLVVVNDWLLHGFKRRKTQLVLQTWHGTMLKNLALLRPNVSFRTKLAVLRQRRKWDLLLSQNPHSTAHFQSAYAYRGKILELGYPRCDALVQAVVAPPLGSKLHADTQLINPIVKRNKRELFGISSRFVVLYAPTWRADLKAVDTLRVVELQKQLGPEWTVLYRGHSRSAQLHDTGSVIDASSHPEITDVLLAADVVITDYSSVMFDAAAAALPLLFFTPDIENYRDQERGFSFDFAATAPGPLHSTAAGIAADLQEYAMHEKDAEWVQEAAQRYAAWQQNYLPHEDGHAAARVVAALQELGI